MAKTLIGVPCMSMVPTEFLLSVMGLNIHDDTKWVFQQNSLVYDARNRIAGYAVAQKFDRILFIDSDMIFDADLLDRLEADMDEGRDIVGALSFKRISPTGPCVYSEICLAQMDDGHVAAKIMPYRDYPRDTLFECAGVGFGAVMISTKLCEEVVQKYASPPFSPLPTMGEDISFCWKAQNMGVKIFCDSRVKLGHIGSAIFDESVYINQRKVVGG